MPAKPFLKSAGGKTKSLPYLLPLLPEKMHTYYEPFVGGGAVFFALAAERRFQRAVLSDSNERLIRTWKAVRDDVSVIIDGLVELKSTHSADQYYEVRAWAVDGLPDPMVAVWMIYLNRTCFNGLYRVNLSGKFNVPVGSYKNPRICDAENLRAVSEVLQGVEITDCDFGFAMERADKGDAVYCDPPYVPLSDTSDFTKYTAKGFDLGEQVRLRDTARAARARGVSVLLSNHDTPKVRALYDGFEKSSIEMPRAINSDGDLRGLVGELAIR